MKSFGRHIRLSEKNEKLGAYAMKRVAASAHLPAPRLFEPAKRPDDRADYCLEKTTGVEENEVWTYCQ